MKKLIALMLILLSLIFVVSCGKGSAKEEVEETGPVHIVLWYDNSSTSVQWYENIVAGFNEKFAGVYEAEAIYVGSIRTKVLTSTYADRPNVFMLTGNQSPLVISYVDENKERLIVPIQKYINEENYDASGLYNTLKMVWGRNGEWQGYPFGAASIGHIFNEAVLNSIGLSAWDLNSLDAIYDACLKLKEAGYSRPYYAYNHSDFYTFAMTAEGVQYYDNNNGWDGEPTQMTIMTDSKCYQATLDYFNFYKKLVDNDLLVDLEIDFGTSEKMFADGEIIIKQIWSEHLTRTVMKFDSSLNFIYREMCTIHEETATAGQASGGRALYIANVQNEKKQKASWELIKYMMQPENNADYVQTVGLLPVEAAGVQTESWQNYMKSIPGLKEACEALDRTPDGVGYAIVGSMADFQALIKQYVSNVVYGKMTPEEATVKFAEETKEAQEMYRLSKGLI